MWFTGDAAMRTSVGLAVLLIASAGATGQEPPPRYDRPLDVRGYPQESPRSALASAIKAIDGVRADYLLANLLDPAQVDIKVAERTRGLAAAAENDLRTTRARQKADPLSVTAEQRLPDEPTAFAQRVAEEATARGFLALSEDVRARFADDPNLLKDLRRLQADGTQTVDGDKAKLTLGGRTIGFRKVENRWFIDDRR